MFRTVIARGASLLLALAATAAWAGPGTSAPATSARRVTERAPVTSNPSLSASREAVYQHMKALGIPAESLQWGLTRIDGVAEQFHVDSETIEWLAAQALDAEGAAKASDIMTAYAEMAAFGQPLTRDFEAQDAPRIDAMSTGAGAGIQEEVPGAPVDESAGAIPKIGGVCQTCPNFDFLLPPPTPAWQTHSSATVGGFNDCAWYRVPVLVGHRYEFSTCQGGGTALWNTIIEIFDPATSCAAFVARNDNDTTTCGATSTLSNVQWDSTVGTFINVRLRGTSTTEAGAYTLAFRDLGIVCESCVTPGAAFPVMTNACQCLSGTTTASCPSKYFSVPLTAGETYTFTTCGDTCTGANASYDTILKVYDPSCAFVVLNDDGCPSAPTTRSTVTFTATQTGTYKIQVTGRYISSTNTTLFGTFTLCGRRDGPGCATCAAGPYRLSAVPTLVCQSHASSVGLCQDAWYDFTLTAGRPYEFGTCSDLPCSAGSATFDTVLDLHDASCGALIATNDDACGSGPGPSKLNFTPAVSGQYRLRVRGAGNATGNYVLTYREINTSCTPPGSVSITPTSGAVAANTCARNETFNVSVDALATAPVTYNWTITPGTGTSATPSFGSVIGVAGGGAPASFNSTLQGAGTFTVQVTAVNACGSLSRNIVYTLLDPQPPSLTVPASTTASCSAVPAPGPVSASDNCTANPAVTFVQTQSPGSCPDNYTINRTWTATDASGNSTSRTQVITVSDTTAPTMTGVPANTAVACNAVPPPASPTATDNCDPGPTVTFAETRVNGPCPDTYTLNRTWTARDRCNNAASQTQTIVVSDTQAPVLSGVPADATVSCDAVPPPATPSATDNCDPAPTVTYTETRINGACAGSYQLTRTWVARDRCNNASSQSQVLNVYDNTPPVVTPNTNQIACLWPPNHWYSCFELSSIVVAATDNCSPPVTWRITNVTSSSAATMPCGDGNQDPDIMVADDGQSFCVQSERCGQDTGGATGGRTYTVEAVAIDACGNESAPAPIGTVFVPHDQRGGISCQRPTVKPSH